MIKKRINELRLVDQATEAELENRRILVTAVVSAILFFVIVSVVGAFFAASVVADIAKALPDNNMIQAYKPNAATQIYDINNKLVATIHGDEQRTLIPLKNISKNLQNAVIAIEDNRFYQHKGIDIVGTLRAGSNNFNGSSMQGGSTLTQQLAKNAFLSQERSFTRKIAEAILSVRMETLYPKEKILEMYLNQIYWGNLAYGAENAAKVYFGKPASMLNISESALMAAMIKAPEGYSPYHNYKAAKARQLVVLSKMKSYGLITDKEYKVAVKQKILLKRPVYYNAQYGYFVDYVRYILEQKYGTETVRNGGLKVYTTLDPEVQLIAEKTILNGVKSIPKYSGVTEGALVSIKLPEGYVQAIVGGVDYRISNYNRAVFSRRAAGSSFKPIVYLTAFSKNIITPNSLIADAPIVFNTGWNIWRPHNWDNRYMGIMTVRKALSLSRNTTTIRVAMRTGIPDIIKMARSLGIKSHIDNNLTISLGSAGVSPLEMANVYATFARDGVYSKPVVIRKVTDSDGNLLEQYTPRFNRIVESRYVQDLNSILIDVVDNGTAKAAKLDDRVVAGKTGTTDDIRDIWFTGYTPDTVTTLWLGNDRNRGMRKVFSSNCAALWGEFSKEYYKIRKVPPKNFN